MPTIRGILAWITGAEMRSGSPENPANALTPEIWQEWGGVRTKANVVVNSTTALTHAAVYACVRILSDSIASLPLEVYRQLPNGNSELAPEHPVHRLVNTAPSRLYSSFQFRSTAQAHIGLTGNAYARIMRDGWARPTELRLLQPNEVQPYIHDNELFYKVEGEKKVLTSDEVIHVANLSTDGIIGKSPITLARETIGMGLAATQYGGAIFGNGTHLAGVLEHPQKLTKEQLENLRGTWRGLYSGAANAGSVPILENGMTYKPISLTPNDSRFIESQKLTIADISRIFRVPLHMIGELDRATFSNIEQQSIEFVQHTLRPLAKAWEQELNRKLFRPSEQGQYFVRFNLNALLRGDMKARGEFYRALFNVRALSPNEIRQLEGLNASDAPGMDDYYIQINMSNNPDADLNGEGATDNQNDTGATEGAAAPK